MYDEKKSSLCEAIKRDIPITEYAGSRGYTVQKAGHWFTLAEMDSIRIDAKTDRVFYRNSNGASGSIIDFVMETEQCSENDAIIKLRYLLPGYSKRYAFQASPGIRTDTYSENEFVLPKKTDKSYKRLYAYLIQTRGISKNAVDFMIHKKQLYQDERQNLVFVGYDKNRKPAYASLRSTLSGYSFKGEAAGSKKEIGMLVNNDSKRLIVCESAIDCMSVMTFISMSNADFCLYDYLSLGGISHRSLFYHMSYKKYTQIIICTDNDTAGNKARKEIRKSLSAKGFPDSIIIDKAPVNKDFNDDLIQYNKTRSDN